MIVYLSPSLSLSLSAMSPPRRARAQKVTLKDSFGAVEAKGYLFLRMAGHPSITSFSFINPPYTVQFWLLGHSDVD